MGGEVRARAGGLTTCNGLGFMLLLSALFSCGQVVSKDALNKFLHTDIFLMSRVTQAHAQLIRKKNL